MATNKRKNARKEKKEKQNRRNRTIIWVVLIIVIAVFLVMKICETDFSDIKDRFTDENGNFSISLTAQKDAYPYTLDTAQQVDISLVNDKLNILTDNSVTVLNPVNAKELYSFDHGYAQPIMTYAGNYFCLYDLGGTRIRLDTDSENKYESNLKNPILAADVAKNGNVIYALRSSKAKSTVVLVNSSLKKLLTYNVSDGYVTAVAVDSSGKKCAFATVNSEDAKLVTKVYTINSGDTDTISEFDFGSTNILDLHYSSSDLFVIGDDDVSVISSQKKKTDVIKQNSANIEDYCYTSSGEAVVDYTKYSGADENTLVYIKSSGKIKTKINFKSEVADMSVSSNRVAVLFDSGINIYSLTNGEKKGSVTCDKNASSVVFAGNNIFVRRGQFVEVEELK